MVCYDSRAFSHLTFLESRGRAVTVQSFLIAISECELCEGLAGRVTAHSGTLQCLVSGRSSASRPLCVAWLGLWESPVE